MSETVTEVVETRENRDVRGRRIAPKLRRAAMLAAYEGGGLTMSAFARREGIKYGTFTGWVYKSQVGGGEGADQIGGGAGAESPACRRR